MERNKTEKEKVTQLGHELAIPRRLGKSKGGTSGGWWEESESRDVGTGGNGGRSWQVLDIRNLKCLSNIHAEIFGRPLDKWGWIPGGGLAGDRNLGGTSVEVAIEVMCVDDIAGERGHGQCEWEGLRSAVGNPRCGGAREGDRGGPDREVGGTPREHDVNRSHCSGSVGCF